MIGGGLSLPIKRWISADLGSMDFAFGTAGPSRVITVVDSTGAESGRNVKNYQFMYAGGPRVNLPLGKNWALGLSSGYSAVVLSEYAVGNSYYQGGTLVTEKINCTSCTQTTFSGPYFGLRIFARSNKYTSIGFDAKYYLVRDSAHPDSPFHNQNWVSAGVVFSFGI
jgi:hypothetical protein